MASLCEINFCSWDPGAASARGAADVKGGEFPPPDPIVEKRTKSDCPTYRKACANVNARRIKKIVSNCL